MSKKTPADTIPTKAPPASMGTELIADYVKRLPSKPGVYRMFGEAEDVLYVGKAKNLKARVTNYTSLNGQSNRIARMITETCAMEFVVTETETESLLLEANLIKSLKPRYNVLMRDDKSFANILIATEHPTALLTKHRGRQRKSGHYFGPFASASAVNRTLNTLQKAFLLRSCSDSVYESRSRPCLLHQIKRCSAPCVDLITADHYNDLVNEAVQFLHGKNADIQAALSVQMEAAASAKEYERAASFRDRIRALTAVQESQGINPQTVNEADLFAIHLDGGQAAIQVFFFRAGQNLGSHAYFPKHDRELPADEILSSFIAQFYDARMPPKLLLISEQIADAALLSDALCTKAGSRVAIATPKRGERKDLVAHALMNAREALGRRLADTASQRKLMQALAAQLDLPALPTRIEVYDNSHISGTNAVGGMVVADEEGFRKNQYRKFNIKDTDIAPGDDYGMMREVLRRRFSRLLKEETPYSDAWPSIVIIDGGAGQLSVAKETMEDAGITIGQDIENGEILLLAIAKGRRENDQGQRRADRSASATGEQFFIVGRTPFTLPPRSPVLYYLQRMRDEVHRYAIGAHRAKRAVSMLSTPLDQVEGIGGKRKRALLNHFGSAKAVAGAKASDLAAVDGISDNLAQRIYDFFHNSG